jgi:hypothetical protein
MRREMQTKVFGWTTKFFVSCNSFPLLDVNYILFVINYGGGGCSYSLSLLHLRNMLAVCGNIEVSIGAVENKKYYVF